MLSAFMTAGMLTGCGGGDDTAQGGAEKIKVFIPGFQVGNAHSVLEEINKRANVDLEVLEDAGGEGETKASLIITTGEDVDWVNITEAQPYQQWGEEGLLNDLAPIIEEHKDELPIINFLVNDDTYKALRGENGEVWAIPAINHVMNQGMRMNETWFKSTGMEMPETTEDVYEVLKAMKEKKCTQADYSPFIADSLYSFNWVFYAHGGRLFDDGNTQKPRYYKENGELKPYDVSDMNKEALKYARRLYQEGLVNKDFQVIGGTSQRTERFYAGKAGMWYSSAGATEQLYESIGEVTVYMGAPEGPTGVRSYGGDAPLYRMNVIPTSVESEEKVLKVLKFIEWMHSEEARLLCVYGIEGRHYQYNENGEVDTNSPEIKANIDNDFGRISGGSCPFAWGWVSPFAGTLEVDKYDTVSEAIANMKLTKSVKKEPVDEDYQGFLNEVNKYLNVYPYGLYSSDDFVFASNTTNEFVENFYVQAIIEPDFDIDAEWEGFVNKYMNEYKGKECLDIFTKLIEE